MTPKTLSLALAAAALAGCVSSGPFITVENQGQGRFRGEALGYSGDLITQEVASEVCGGTPPRDISFRTLPDGTTFFGIC